MASAVAVLLLGATTILIGIRFWFNSRRSDEEVTA
jgi:hypothetical protein